MRVEAPQPREEVTFDVVKPTDVLVIRTINSLYRFFVTDPLRHCGLLFGGSISEEPAEAFCINSSLRVGTHASFLYGTEAQNKYMRTSNILELTHVRNA
jgi:hypothetical protein